MVGRATSENWFDPPFNRWAFSHVRELTRTARVGRGGAPVWRLPERAVDLGGFHVHHGADRCTYVEMLQATYTDAVVIVHEGELVFEYYDRDVRPDDTHLLMGVSAPLVATVIGVLVAQGLLATDGLVTTYLPELAGTVWEGCTVQHLLDMRAGVAFDEHDQDDPAGDGRGLEQVSGFTTPPRPGLPTDTLAWIRALPAQGAHGGPFVHRSILTSLLGRVAEAVSGERFADLFTHAVWSRLGAEHDADLVIDPAGFGVAGGGLCVTARDLARFGLMHLQQGLVGGNQLVSTRWVDRVLRRDPDSIEAFAAGVGGTSNPEAYYRDGWWVHHAGLGRYGGYGVGGQHLLIDRASNTVVVKLSSTPRRNDAALNAFADSAHEALLRLLGA